MRVLEARFHPRKKNGGPTIVVGRVYCEGNQARVEPAAVDDDPGARPARSAMQEKLRYLVRTTGKPLFERLRRLHSDYWSFVEIPAEESRGASERTAPGGAHRDTSSRGSRTEPSRGGKP